jgi:hypothetical protein
VGIDYLYLEAIRGADAAHLRRAIVEEMVAEGWEEMTEADLDADVTREGAVDVTIEIAERDKWLVVHDVREKLPIEWAERLAHALGVWHRWHQRKVVER